MALQLLQNGAQALGILGAHPIELEPVAHQYRDFGLVLGNLGLEGLDPGVELLLGQLLGQLFHALQPQLFTRTSGVRGGIKGDHKICGQISDYLCKKQRYQKFIHRPIETKRPY
jgi:hypothetical protein